MPKPFEQTLLPFRETNSEFNLHRKKELINGISKMIQLLEQGTFSDDKSVVMDNYRVISFIKNSLLYIDPENYPFKTLDSQITNSEIESKIIDNYVRKLREVYKSIDGTVNPEAKACIDKLIYQLYHIFNKAELGGGKHTSVVKIPDQIETYVSVPDTSNPRLSTLKKVLAHREIK